MPKISELPLTEIVTLDDLLLVLNSDTNAFNKLTIEDWLKTTNDIIPAARAKSTSDQTISTSTNTTVDLAQETFDTANMWNSGNPDILSCTIPGKYLIFGHIRWTVGTTGARIQWIEHNNDGSIIWSVHDPVNDGTYGTEQHAVGIWDMAEGEYIYMRVRQTSGSNKQLQINHQFQSLGMVRVG